MEHATPSAPPAPASALQAVLEAVTAPVLLCDGQRIHGANDAMCRLLAMPLPQLLQGDAQAWAAPEHRAALLHYTGRCRDSADALTDTGSTVPSSLT